MMIFSLVAMTGLEKCCMTSAYLQWLCHSGERPVAHGLLVLFSYAPLYVPVIAMHFHPFVSMSLLHGQHCVLCLLFNRTVNTMFVCLVWLLELTFFSDKSCQNRQVPDFKGDNPNIKYETFEPMCIRTLFSCRAHSTS